MNETRRRIKPGLSSRPLLVLIGWLCICGTGKTEPGQAVAEKQAGTDTTKEQWQPGPERHRRWVNGRELHGSGVGRKVESCFDGLSKGRFEGSVSGLLAADVSAPGDPEEGAAVVSHLWRLETRPAQLEIIPDEHEVYDVSEKHYRVAVPGGTLTYTTYAGANALKLELGGETYEHSSIDGGCDVGIDFLNYDFLRDGGNECLVLTVTEPLWLSHGNAVVLKPGSVLIFRIERPVPSKRTAPSP